MKSPKYTRRRNGRDMVNIKLTFAVDRSDVEKLAKALNIRESAALNRIREEYYSSARDGIDWHAFACYVDDGSIAFAHVDDIGTTDECAYRPL